jgi:hypothetical protein
MGGKSNGFPLVFQDGAVLLRAWRGVGVLQNGARIIFAVGNISQTIGLNCRRMNMSDGDQVGGYHDHSVAVFFA